VKATPRAKVITNDDIASSEPTAIPAKGSSNDAFQDGAKKEGEETTQAASSAEGENKGTIAENDTPAGKDSVKNRTDPAKEREAQELETQKRTNEINQRYLDRIAAVRVRLNAAQLELAKLQRDQVESTNEFTRTLGVSPNPGTYDQQQRLFIQQIEAQRNLINSLNSQLEDAKELARHAGVPHATD
jgi:hypothetical protein